jgi:hypothetical protein
MKNLAAGFLLLFWVAAPPLAWADNPTTVHPLLRSDTADSDNRLRELLKNLDFVAKAYAAECKDEGELCKTNAECCPGLECSGDPQTTCLPQE